MILQDLGLIDENLTAKHVIDILGANNPNALQDGDCNLEIEVVNEFYTLYQTKNYYSSSLITYPILTLFVLIFTIDHFLPF